MKSILLLLLIAIPVLASEEPNLRPGERVRFSGTVEAIIGHSFGYVPPEKGASFQIDLNDLPKQQLNFGKTDGAGNTYIPITGTLQITSVRRYNNTESTPSAIRLVSNSKTHKVTIDIINNNGGVDGNASKMWILIESQGSIIGVWQLIGNVEYKQAEP